MNELFRRTACDVVERLRSGEVTPHELLDALERRIADVDGEINALPTLCFDRARGHADRLMALAPGERGLLAGLPVPIKDLSDVAGVRSTQGSPIFADRVPETSDIMVERLEHNGAVVYAKSNTPEFGAGGHTFNEVFGTTLNPWNLSRSASGSSGGAAAALAAGMAWVAQGSDLGGSLRNPASFCGVVGLRPSPGRVAHVKAAIGGLLSVEGPMARNVEDAGLLLDAMTGEHPGDPISLPSGASSFLVRGAFRMATAPCRGEPRSGNHAGRTGSGRDCHGCGTPVRRRRRDRGGSPPGPWRGPRVLPDAARPVIRGLLQDALRDPARPAQARDHVEHRKGTCAHRARDRARRAPAHRHVPTGTHPSSRPTISWCAPTTIVAPFPAAQRYVESCAGHRFDNYVEWLAIAYAITLIACPAISIPAGFTAEGLPVGLQIVAPPRAEARLLAGAKLLEGLLGLKDTMPIDPRG
jgi:amidase